MSTPEGPRRLLITGGAGFLGAALLRELARPEPERVLSPEEIRLFDLRPAEASPDPRVSSRVGDVRDYAAVLDACRDVDCVIHSAGLVDWGRSSEAELSAVNLEGTRNLLRACREAGVAALVHTSTMDVIWGDGPIRRADETYPYPRRFGNAYSRTKALAEQEVVRTDGSPRAARPGESAEPVLRTCVLRPCGMFGEADPYHVTQFARVLEAGGLPFRIGSGRAVFQHVYVGNVAHAHLLAARALFAPEPVAAGQVYFAADHPAKNFFEFMEPIAAGLGYAMPPRSRRLPFPLVLAVGALVEATSRLLRPIVAFQPTLTRTSVRMVCEDFEIASDKAARHLGYAPLYSEEEAVARTVAWFRENGPVAR